MKQEICEMHWKDGWLFKRLDNGEVRLRKWAGAALETPGPYEEAVIPAAEWVSLIQHLSHEQTVESFARAEVLHCGNSVAAPIPRAGEGEDAERRDA